MLARVHARVVQVPQLGPLVARVPLAELVAEREDALLGARLLLVAPRAADRARRSRTRRSPRAASPTGAALRLSSSDAQAHACRAGSNPRPSARSGARRARRRAGRGTRSPRESCARCRCAAAGTGSARDGTPSRRAAAARCESLPPEKSSAGFCALPGDLAQDVDRFRLEPVEVRCAQPSTGASRSCARDASQARAGRTPCARPPPTTSGRRARPRRRRRHACRARSRCER